MPSTHMERLFVMLAAVAGGGLYAYLVGAVCGVSTVASHSSLDVWHDSTQSKGFSSQTLRIPND